ncbi:GNAT family N-acetyltransferase [Bacillus sp. CGMCC 1.16607]|uniref:GNAT family N-acetyltransferase n=1 Tax=Bacillus sp. CGMCC 1.16607 TaxID=3351842 RepID=UPI00363BC581
MVDIREATILDLPAMLDIYNYAIRHLTATFDIEVQTLDKRKIWFDSHDEKYPLIVAERNGEVVGYCCLSSFRAKPAYSKTTEISIYISQTQQGYGIGSALMKEIIRRAIDLGYHTIIAGITGGNEGSVKLHKKFGFEFVGCFKEVGFKFGEWQDVDFYQLMINNRT